jgi:hypothetical protein
VARGRRHLPRAAARRAAARQGRRSPGPPAGQAAAPLARVAAARQAVAVQDAVRFEARGFVESQMHAKLSGSEPRLELTTRIDFGNRLEVNVESKPRNPLRNLQYNLALQCPHCCLELVVAKGTSEFFHKMYCSSDVNLGCRSSHRQVGTQNST